MKRAMRREKWILGENREVLHKAPLGDKAQPLSTDREMREKVGSRDEKGETDEAGVVHNPH